MRAWIDVAVLAKARNSKGRFAVTATAGLPFILQPDDEVAFVPPQLDVPRSAVVKDVKLVDDHKAEVTFEGLDDPDAMDVLVGSHCLMKRSELDESVYADAPGMWDGWTVVDEALGEIGNVVDIVDNPAQMLLEVERADGQGTVLVPVVDEIITSVDPEALVVAVHLPNGLLDV